MIDLSFKRQYQYLYATVLRYQTSANFLPYCILGVLFLVNMLSMWPGQMSPDSYTQYNAALHGIFDDHHPPMMSLVWGFLNRIYPGPGLLFLTHLLMLYGACFVFIASIPSTPVKLFYSMLPLIPHILFYSSMLWKDVGFAFSFLLAVALLHYYMHEKKRISVWAVSVIGVLIFYGSAVKFQGQYVAPLVILGVWYCLDQYEISCKTVGKTFITTFLFLYILHSFNDFFVPFDRKAHSWQCVKLYDLAAMSVYTQRSLFPSFLTSSPHFSLKAVQERFNHKRVDDLFMPPANPLRLCKDAAERDTLLSYWRTVTWHHMSLYLFHRFVNWWTMVTNMPLQHFETMDFSQFGGIQWFVALQKAAAHENPLKLQQAAMHYAGKLLYALLYGLRYCFKFVFLIPCMIFYGILGIRYYRRYGTGMPLVLMNGISMWFLAVLFFCSMASDMRYAYIAACMTHASHGIAYGLWRSQEKNASSKKETA